MKIKIQFLNRALFCGLAVLPIFYSCKSVSSKKKYEPAFSFDSSGKKVLIYGIPNITTFKSSDLFIQYLNKNLKTARIRIVASKDADEYKEGIKKREFDLTISNGPLLLSAEKEGYSITAKMGDDSKYTSVIFVRNDSAINYIADLKGKTIVTSNPIGLAGSMMPLLFLQKKGLDVNKDIKRIYATSFESAIMNVYIGKCSAGTSRKEAIENFLRERPEVAARVSIKWETPPLINSAFLIKNGMDPALINELNKLILTMQDNEEGRKALEQFYINRFERANAETYRPLEDFIKEYNATIH